MPLLPKSTRATQPVVPLPDKHVAILFEGAWLFRPDPADAARVQAICPYVDSTEHVCDYRVWPFEPGAKGTVEFTATLPEGDGLTIGIEPSREATASYHTVFEAGAAKYGFIYVGSASSNEKVGVSSPAKARTISFPVPDEIRAAGKLEQAVITAGKTSARYKLGIDGKPVSLFVTLIFIYHYSGDMPQFTLASTTGCELAPLDPAPDTSVTHLVIRVHEPSTTKRFNLKVEDEHFVETFNLIRNMMTIQTGQMQPLAAVRPDFVLTPPAQQMVFDQGDTNLTLEELGLPDKAAIHPVYGNLAACAGGTHVINSGG